MHQLVPEDFSVLERFFVDAPPNNPMLRAFLGRRVPGQAYIDDERAPKACVLAVNYRFVFFGGEPSRPFLEQALHQLRMQHPLHVVWKPGRVRLPPGPAPDRVAERVEFSRRESPAPGHLDTLAARAPHAEVRRIDSQMMRRCLWREDVLRATGSTSEFLGHGLGFCLMIEEQIVAESYAVIWSGERAEIAAVTHPEQRGKGYATVVCASLIKACENVDLSTYWNCDADNVPSMRLAARLGYGDPRPYRLLHFDTRFAGTNRGAKSARTFGGFARRLFSRGKVRR
jgi:RimJ/RimL family protein N-acetyltransferase